ncbi:hypothetical protein Tco_0597506 [Tanacetum coccineum]
MRGRRDQITGWGDVCGGVRGFDDEGSIRVWGGVGMSDVGQAVMRRGDGAGGRAGWSREGGRDVGSRSIGFKLRLKTRTNKRNTVRTAEECNSEKT